MGTTRYSPLYVQAFFVDGPLAGRDRMIAPAPDGSPQQQITLPDPDQPSGAPGVTYERTDLGDTSGVARYRVQPADEPVFEVAASRWEQGYQLAIAGVGATQTHDEDTATVEETVRDYLHLTLDRPASSFQVRIRYAD